MKPFLACAAAVILGFVPIDFALAGPHAVRDAAIGIVKGHVVLADDDDDDDDDSSRSRSSGGLTTQEMIDAALEGIRRGQASAPVMPYVPPPSYNQPRPQRSAPMPKEKCFRPTQYGQNCLIE
jgi:hypothetical protein